MAAFDLGSIVSARQVRPRRMVVLGQAKAGKSTFAGEAPEPIFLPIRGEEGIDDLNVQTFPVISTYGDLMKALGSLCEGEHSFKTVVIDSISTLEPIVWDETCLRNGKVESIEKVGGGYAKGYIEALRYWRNILETLDYLRQRGMGTILVGHVKVKKFNDPTCEPYDRYFCDINDKAAELITRWADGVLFVGRKIKVKKEDAGFNTQSRAVDLGGGQPFMFTQERPSHPGGGRGAWGQLPYEMPLSWADLQTALDAAQNGGGA